MQCQEIMSQKPYFLTTQQTAREAAAQMRVLNLAFLPVCDAQRRVVGALSDRDLVLRLLADGRAASTPVQELMSAQIFSCQTTDQTGRAAELMQENEVSRLVCLDGQGRLAGMVDTANVQTGAAMVATPAGLALAALAVA